jgi:hypothetical protein
VGVGAGAPPQAAKTNVNKTIIEIVFICVFIVSSNNLSPAYYYNDCGEKIY